MQCNLQLGLKHDVVRHICFFSARWIIGSLFRKVQTRIQKTVKSWSRIAQSHIVDAVFDLASSAIVLPFDAGVFAFGGDNLLADL